MGKHLNSFREKQAKKKRTPGPSVSCYLTTDGKIQTVVSQGDWAHHNSTFNLFTKRILFSVTSKICFLLNIVRWKWEEKSKKVSHRWIPILNFFLENDSWPQNTSCAQKAFKFYQHIMAEAKKWQLLRWYLSKKSVQVILPRYATLNIVL